MRLPSAYALTASLVFLSFDAVQAQGSTQLVGTWSTKSNKTLTGPGFYDPVNENMIEPARTGISYSFTADGFYEEAYYRAIANPQNPSCPSGIMQWQHGTYTLNANLSLSLTPFAVDGRQLLSTPCNTKNSIYTRYNQSELMAKWAVYTDPYHGVPRLDLYKFDGSPIQPMYLAYSPPMMLPTTTLNPTASATGGSKSTSTSSSKLKRGLGLGDTAREVPINWKTSRTGGVDPMNPDHWWWIGLTMTGVGGLLYFGPRRAGIHL